MNTLALRLGPIDGESLPGYLHRYGCTFGIPPSDTLRATGLLTDEQPLVAAGPYPLCLSGEQAVRFCTATALERERLETMLLSRFEGIAFDVLPSDWSMRQVQAALIHVVSLWRPRACPDCLRENGAWRLHWLLRWSVVCVRHERLLFSFCPGCEQSLRVGRWGRWPRDEHGAERGSTTCWQRHQGKICRYPLHEADSPRVDGDQPLLEAQRRVDEVLDGQRTPVLAGKECEPLQYLRDLSALVRLTQEDQVLPGGSAGEQIASGRTLADPARVAPALAKAIAMADAPDPDTLSDAIRAVLDRRHAASGWLVPKAAGFHVGSPLLREAIQHARTRTSYANVSARFGFDPRHYRRPADLHPELEPRHVPQLYWREDYERELAQLFRFGKFTPSMGRRFCSALLVRMLTPASWANASRYLGLAVGDKQDGLKGSLTQFHAHGSMTKLIETIKSTASNHATTDRLVDYEQRRAHMTSWEGIDASSWRYLQPSPHPDPLYPVFSNRRANASVWLWCELTSGHERAAPVKLPSSVENYRHFEARHLDGLRDRLLVLGQLLLDTPPTAQSTIAAQFAAALTQRGEPPAASPERGGPAAPRRQQRKAAAGRRLATVDPIISERVLAHVSAHTGVDIQTITTPARGSERSPAATHARLLAAALLRRMTVASWPTIAPTLDGDPHRLSLNNSALKRNPTLASELQRLISAVENRETAIPIGPTTPHHKRMRDIAASINAHATELFTPRYAADLRLRTSMLACRTHTDLTWAAIAAIHDIPVAQPAWLQTVITRHRRDDPDFNHRYQQLLHHAQELQREAGFANAYLTRGLASKRTTLGEGSKYVSNVQVA